MAYTENFKKELVNNIRSLCGYYGIGNSAVFREYGVKSWKEMESTNIYRLQEIFDTLSDGGYEHD